MLCNEPASVVSVVEHTAEEGVHLEDVNTLLTQVLPNNGRGI